MLEGVPVLVHLVLGQSLGVPHQDLVLHLVDRLRHRLLQVLPTDSQVLHRVRGEVVVEHQRFLQLLFEYFKYLFILIFFIRVYGGCDSCSCCKNHFFIAFTY